MDDSITWILARLLHESGHLRGLKEAQSLIRPCYCEPGDGEHYHFNRLDALIRREEKP